MAKLPPIMADLERIKGLTTQKGRKRYAIMDNLNSNHSIIIYIALFSLHHHKSTDLIVRGSLAGTTPVSRIFVLQVIKEEGQCKSEQVIPDVIRL